MAPIPNDDEEESQSPMKIDDQDSGSGQFGVFTRNGMTRIPQCIREFNELRRVFAVMMGPAASGATSVTAAHMNLPHSQLPVSRKARLSIFEKFAQLSVGPTPNLRYACYIRPNSSNSSKVDIGRILEYGFSSLDGDEFGRIQLCSITRSLDAAKADENDDDGLRHMMVCRVLVGKVEELVSGSGQVAPSSDEFDTGVDCGVNPGRYFMWSTRMNSHIWPAFVISFKGPASFKGYSRRNVSVVASRGSSARLKELSAALGRVSSGCLVAALTRFLNPREMKIMIRLLEDYNAEKFGLDELNRKVRLIAGDRLTLAFKLATPVFPVKGASGTLGGVLQVANTSVEDICLPDLITVLAEFLPATKIKMLRKTLDDFKNKKITRQELARSMELIVADNNVLVAAINTYRNRKKRPAK